MQLVEFIIEEKEEKEKMPHLDSALEECGEACSTEFEDTWNIWDWHKGWG